MWIIIIVRYVLPIVTLCLMLYLSRTREYMADAGCVELLRDNNPLGNALLKIRDDHLDNCKTVANAYKNTAHESIRREAYIFDPVKEKINSIHSPSDMLSTHPGIKKRLKAIGITL